jgi:Asp-tRNA(Asn)/Glu-tRNA(Gln) amidotransferase B subunit
MASERYSITTGILDNDPKGLTGRGTLFYMTVSLGDKTVEYHEWGLLNELAGKFSPALISKTYRDLNRKADLEDSEREAKQKQKAQEDRAAAVKDDPALLTLIDEATSSETKAIAEYLSGKEKALNAVVGKIIGLCKKQSIQADAFKITTLLKKRLHETQQAT